MKPTYYIDYEKLGKDMGVTQTCSVCRKQYQFAMTHYCDSTIAEVQPQTNKVYQGGRKADSEKSRLDLVIPGFIEGIGDILKYGAAKYADRNWEKGIAYGRCYAACCRHLYAWWRGEELDKESGYSHLLHAACNLMFLFHFNRLQEKYKKFDDRPTD